MPNVEDRNRDINGRFQPDYLDELDWESKFKDAKSLYDLQKLYKEFCITMFGRNGELDQNVLKLLEDLRLAIQTEMLSKGFTFMQNPFLTYVRDFVVKNPESFTKEKYNLIHNAYLDRLIDDNDLKGKGFFKKDNLIFDPEFFKLDQRLMKQYLVLQNRFKNISSSDIGNTKILNKYNNFEKDADKKQFVTDMFKNGLPAKDFYSVLHSNKKDPLRNAHEINQLLALVGANKEEAEDVGRRNYKDLVNSCTTIQQCKDVLTGILYGLSLDVNSEKNKQMSANLTNILTKHYLNPKLTDAEKSKIFRTTKQVYNVSKGGEIQATIKGLIDKVNQMENAAKAKEVGKQQ